MSAIGLRVGPFEICEEAAVPGPDSWYRAERTGLSRRQPSHVLVRLLGPSPTSRELSSAQRHFDVLRSLDDRRFPKAVALYEGSGALAVEAVPGLPMSHIVEARLLGDVPMTPATVLDLALEMTEAMAHAHGKGAHHGHLSAESVTLGVDGRVLVWGMGEFDGRPPFTWLAPELARGEQTSDQTDQWSLGALIVAMVTGRSPWNATSASSAPAAGQIEEFVGPVARQWPALGRLCRRMLDANPQLRFPSLHPVRLELLGLARRAGGSSDRRALGAWLHRRDAEGRATPEMVSEAPSPAPAPPLAPPTVEPPAIQARVGA
ncbi:MAG: protein kinase, partial [Myxococcota bacterium]